MRNNFSLCQKLFRGAVLIMILLQTACATNLAMLGDRPKDLTTPNPSEQTSNDADAALTCSMDVPGEDSARPKVQANVRGISTRPKAQPRAQGDARMGARIVLLLRNQRKIAGRLLSVRDHALVISTNEAQANHLDAQIADLLVVEILDLLSVSFKEDAKVQKGAAIGFLIGAGTGAIIGFAAGDDPPCNESGSPLAPSSCWRLTAGGKAVLGGIVGGVAGLLVGSLAGAAASSADKAGASQVNHDFSALKPFAQFPKEEPGYLNAVK